MRKCVAITSCLLALFPFRTIWAEDRKPDVSRIFGKVQIVNAFPDYKVRVSNTPDLKVRIVNAFPDAAGEWQIVSSFPDYTVMFVTTGEDFTVQFR